MIDFLTRQEEEDRKCPECRRPANLQNCIPVTGFNARYNKPPEADPKGKGRADDEVADDGLNAPLDIVVPGELDDWISSSKIDRMLDVVRDVTGRREKIIIFSQFTSLLRLIEKPLNQEGIKYLTVSDMLSARGIYVNSHALGCFLTCPIFCVAYHKSTTVACRHWRETRRFRE